MTPETDEQHYAKRAHQELAFAVAAKDPGIKALHLNMAANYVTLREEAVKSHKVLLE